MLNVKEAVVCDSIDIESQDILEGILNTNQKIYNLIKNYCPEDFGIAEFSNKGDRCSTRECVECWKDSILYHSNKKSIKGYDENVL